MRTLGWYHISKKYISQILFCFFFCCLLYVCVIFLSPFFAVLVNLCDLFVYSIFFVFFIVYFFYFFVFSLMYMKFIKLPCFILSVCMSFLFFVVVYFFLFLMSSLVGFLSDWLQLISERNKFFFLSNLTSFEGLLKTALNLGVFVLF